MLGFIKRIFVKDEPSNWMVKKVGSPSSDAQPNTSNFIDGVTPFAGLLLLISRIRLTTVGIVAAFSIFLYNESQKPGSFVNVKGRAVLTIVGTTMAQKVSDLMRQTTVCLKNAKSTSSFAETMNCITGGDIKKNKPAE